MGQNQRFLLIITYKDDTFAGDLNNSIDFQGSKDDEAIRSINDYAIDFARLKAKLQRYKNAIAKVEYLVDYDFEQNHKEQFESNWIKIER